MSNTNHLIPSINVTPLIDILLVLLIIFMIISPVQPEKFEARIPHQLPPPDTNYVIPDSLVVSIDSQGRFLLNRQPAETLEDLAAILRAALDRRPLELRTVFVKAPRILKYGEVVRVIDAIKGAGSAPIGLQIEGLDN